MILATSTRLTWVLVITLVTSFISLLSLTTRGRISQLTLIPTTAIAGLMTFLAGLSALLRLCCSSAVRCSAAWESTAAARGGR